MSSNARATASACLYIPILARGRHHMLHIPPSRAMHIPLLFDAPLLCIAIARFSSPCAQCEVGNGANED